MLPQIIRSSNDPTKLALTIRGILVGLVPLAMVLTGLTEAEINPIIEALTDLVLAVTTLFAVIWTVYGLIRKVFRERWSHPG